MKRENVEMVKQGFEVQKLRLEQEWMRELMEKERLEKEREMERNRLASLNV